MLKHFSMLLGLLMIVSTKIYGLNKNNFLIPTWFVVGQNHTYAAPLLTISADNAHSWQEIDITDKNNHGIFSAISCSHEFCVTVGQSHAPILATSMNAGLTWRMLPPINGLTNYGAFYSVNCVDHQSNIICSIVGEDFNTGAPLLVVSTDSGITWNIKSITEFPRRGYLRDTRCIKNNGSVTCIAVGHDDANSGPPLLVVSQDAGVTWTVKTVKNISSGVLMSVTCSKTQHSSLCLAVGQNVSNNSPLLLMSKDSGHSWAPLSLSILPKEGYFHHVNCANHALNTICIAAGRDFSNNLPLLMISIDSGTTWFKALLKHSTDAAFYHSSCSIGGTCIAVGQDFIHALPLLAVSQYPNITNWQIKRVASITKKGIFTASTCADNNAISTCVAVGQTLSGSKSPLLIKSIDQGNTWEVMPILGTMSGRLKAIITSDDYTKLDKIGND